MIFLYKYFNVLNVWNVPKNSYVEKQFWTILINSLLYGYYILLFPLGMIVPYTSIMY
jgi:hypothetical protein